MRLRHYPVFNGASMAQFVLRHYCLALRQKHGAFSCAIAFAVIAHQWRKRARGLVQKIL
jgi:hypothetical protein